ncbi:unnamed protein product [Protopolystoma xenopodis]|uniref:Uncharacterized protein n=1 Tax=Protopolystoma xenopodis TaxID=117903 RepID=A0A3S5AI26_9PLAT|nr:unnamed protein product [Protopolystoma xenopodis]
MLNQTRPSRNLFSKWYVNHYDWPWDQWPDYLTAGSIVVSTPLARRFAVAQYYTQYFRFDDVFLGIMALKLHCQPIHHEGFLIMPPNMTSEER